MYCPTAHVLSIISDSELNVDQLDSGFPESRNHYFAMSEQHSAGIQKSLFRAIFEDPWQNI